MTDEERAQFQDMHDELAWISYKLQQRPEETRAEMVLRVEKDLRVLYRLTQLMSEAAEQRTKE